MFLINLGTGLIMILGLAITLSSDNLRFWPLNGSRIKQIVVWFLIILYYFSLIMFLRDSFQSVMNLELLNWLGVLLFIVGVGFCLWAIFLLRISRTFGLKGELYTEGPYKLCRNPQCTGLIAASLGAVLITFNLAVILLMMIHIVYLILTVFTEESWLKEQYGKSYEDYREEVPRRFIIGGTVGGIIGGTGFPDFFQYYLLFFDIQQIQNASKIHAGNKKYFHLPFVLFKPLTAT